MKEFLLSLFIVLNISISENKITGFIYDKETNETLAGVKIMLENKTIYSDINGYFEIKENIDTIPIKFKYISYHNIDTVFIQNENIMFSNIK